jgi:hypothetical protein
MSSVSSRLHVLKLCGIRDCHLPALFLAYHVKMNICTVSQSDKPNVANAAQSKNQQKSSGYFCHLLLVDISFLIFCVWVIANIYSFEEISLDLKGEFVRSTLCIDDVNPDERFAELCFLCRPLEVEYGLKTFGDAKILIQIIYNIKYKMQSTAPKD